MTWFRSRLYHASKELKEIDKKVCRYADSENYPLSESGRDACKKFLKNRKHWGKRQVVNDAVDEVIEQV